MTGSMIGPATGISGNPVGLQNALVPREGPKALPIIAALSGGITQVEIDLTLAVQSRRIELVQGVYVDNGGNASPVTITVLATQQRLIIPAYTQGYVPLLAGDPPRFIVTSTGGVNVPLIFLNVPVPAVVWVAASAGNATVNQGAAGAAPWPTQLQIGGNPIGPTNAVPVTIPSGDDILAFSVAIASGASDSAVITNAARFALVNIMPPAGWTAANLAVLGSLDNATFAPLQDVTGSPIAFPFGATNALQVPPALVMGWPYLKLRSVNASDGVTPVNQAAARTLAGTLKRA